MLVEAEKSVLALTAWGVRVGMDLLPVGWAAAGVGADASEKRRALTVSGLMSPAHCQT